MKKQSFTMFTSVTKEQLANLTKEVKETIAFGLVEPHGKVFTAAELWNIRAPGKIKDTKKIPVVKFFKIIKAQKLRP